LAVVQNRWRLSALHHNRLRERPEPREEEANQLVLPVGEQIDSNNEDDVLVFNSGADKINLRQHIEGDNSFLDIVRHNYVNDNLLSKVVADVSAHKQFVRATLGVRQTSRQT